MHGSIDRGRSSLLRLLLLTLSFALLTSTVSGRYLGKQEIGKMSTRQEAQKRRYPSHQRPSQSGEEGDRPSGGSSPALTQEFKNWPFSRNPAAGPREAAAYRPARYKLICDWLTFLRAKSVVSRRHSFVHSVRDEKDRKIDRSIFHRRR